MNRKIVGPIIALAGLIILAITFAVYDGGRLAAHYKDSDYIAHIISTRESDDSLDFGKIYIDDEELFKGENGAYYFSIIDSRINITSNKLSIRGGQGGLKYTVNKKSFTREDIKNNTPLEITFYNKDKFRKVQIYTTTLPLLSIDTTGGYLVDDYIDYESLGTEAVFANLRLYDNRENVIKRDVLSEANIHIRGASSSTSPKPAIKISLGETSLGGHSRKHDENYLGMREDDDWILNSMYYDYFYAREYFATTLWKLSQEDRGGRDVYDYRYVELIFDGEYEGLFLLGYKQDHKTTGTNKNYDGSTPETSYKFSDWLAEKRVWDEEDEFDIYILNEYHARAQNTASLAPEARDELKKYMLMLRNGTDINEIYEKSDIDNAIDVFILANSTQNGDALQSDGNVKNFYLSFLNTDEGRKAHFSPWDQDLTFHNNFEPFDPIAQETADPNYDIIPRENAVFRLIELGDNQIAQSTVDRYKQLRSEKWSDGQLVSLISDIQTNTIDSGAIKREYVRWNNSERYADEELANHDKFRDYILKRFAHLDELYTSENFPNIVNLE